MVAGQPNVDYPDELTGLSILQLGMDDALTSRVRRVSASYIFISPPRDPAGERAAYVDRDMLELSWQADDGLRSLPAETVGQAEDGSWRVQVTGSANKVQRRDAVRAPIGLPLEVSWDQTVLVGSTVDLSEGGLLAVFRAHGDLGVTVPFPRRGQALQLKLDLYEDELVTQVELVRRRPRDDQRHEWSMKFVDLPESAADLIRSHVFTALRNARARGLQRLY
jgi:hypothetical protein